MSASRGAQFSLASAIVFALVAVGFAAFILFWKAPAEDNSAPKTMRVLSVDEKAAILKQIGESSTETPPPSSGEVRQPPASQADPNDTKAADKMRILQMISH